MRLWTVHPKYLDPQGLTALWREALLAQAVLWGRVRGYARHPQLTRFAAHRRPRSAIAAYLWGIHDEAVARGYRFDRGRIRSRRIRLRLAETKGQLLWEWRHLKAKLRRRSPSFYRAALRDEGPRSHPIFRIVAGGVRPWEGAAGRRPR